MSPSDAPSVFPYNCLMLRNIKRPFLYYFICLFELRPLQAEWSTKAEYLLPMRSYEVMTSRVNPSEVDFNQRSNHFAGNISRPADNVETHTPRHCKDAGSPHLVAIGSNLRILQTLFPFVTRRVQEPHGGLLEENGSAQSA